MSMSRLLFMYVYETVTIQVCLWDGYYLSMFMRRLLVKYVYETLLFKYVYESITIYVC